MAHSFTAGWLETDIIVIVLVGDFRYDFHKKSHAYLLVMIILYLLSFGSFFSFIFHNFISRWCTSSRWNWRNIEYNEWNERAKMLRREMKISMPHNVSINRNVIYSVCCYFLWRQRHNSIWFECVIFWLAVDFYIMGHWRASRRLRVGSRRMEKC